MTDNEITLKALKELLEVMLCEGDLQRVSTVSHAIEHITRQKAEIERLTHNLEAMAVTLSNSAKATRHEAYKAFAEEFKSIAGIYQKDTYVIGVDEFDNLLKEKVGDSE